MNNRAYSLLEIKAVHDELRVIEGIATTPEPDRIGDVIETEGIEYRLPMPFLWQHNAKEPIGKVVEAKKKPEGIFVKIQVAAAGTAEYIDRAFTLIKAGLVPGLSIGFRPLEDPKPIKNSNGFRFPRTEWMELSAVTIAANQTASILTVKSADAATLALSGRERRTVSLASTPPAVAGLTRARGTPMAKTIQDTIAASEAKIAANESRIDALIQKGIDAGTTPEEADEEEIKTLQAETKKLTDYVALLKSRETEMVARATAVTSEATRTPEKAAENRTGTVTVKSMAPKGIGVARMAIAMVRANNNPMAAMEYAKRYWPDDQGLEMTLKATVEAGDTTTSGWASQLVPAAQQMNDEFLELLRPETIIGRIPGLRRVPFNIAVPIETASGTAQWVGEGAPKPVTKLTLSSVTLRWAKAAAIVAITKELAKFSRPDAELVVRDSMVKTLVRFFDAHFVSATAEVSNVSPAGILNGISGISPSGTTAAAFRTDMNNLLNNMTTNNVPLSNIVILMSATSAVAFSLTVTDLGVPLFPSVNRDGGSILGFPVVVSEAVGDKIIAINANDILLAEDPGVMVDVSDQASLEMSDTPIVGDTSPITGAVLKSLWQNNLIGIRVEQFITWKRGRDAAVEFITGAAYVP